MKKGEKVILGIIVVVSVSLMAYRSFQVATGEKDPGIPFYTTASVELKRDAEAIYRRSECSNCHTLWMVRSMLESVPAPALDGIGSLRDEKWLYDYLSAVDPQAILPSRLKAQYRMPSYAHLPEAERRMLAAYLSSLKVEDWYLDETRQAEQAKLLGADAVVGTHEKSTDR
jgi:cbb3-type cytochrome oxidase cytochrome c subunit